MNEYTGKQRVVAAFRKERTDRVPFTTMIVDNRAWLKFLGITPNEYYSKPEKALEALDRAEERFPADMIWVPGDPLMPEATSFWIESKYGTGVRLPPPIKDKADLAKMTVRDPKQHSAYSAYLDMCAKVFNLYKDSWVEAYVTGIWSNAGGLRGLETLIYDTKRDPSFVHDLMRFATEYGKARGMAIAETGVNVLYADPSAGCSVISPKIYREFIMPYHIQLFQYLKKQLKKM